MQCNIFKFPKNTLWKCTCAWKYSDRMFQGKEKRIWDHNSYTYWHGDASITWKYWKSIFRALPCGIGTLYTQWISFGHLLGYLGFVSVLLITTPHPVKANRWIICNNFRNGKMRSRTIIFWHSFRIMLWYTSITFCNIEDDHENEDNRTSSLHLSAHCACLTCSRPRTCVDNEWSELKSVSWI